MYTPVSLPLFTKRVSNLRFTSDPTSEKNRYRIFYLPENISFSKAYPLLNLKRVDVRHYVSPRIVMKTTGIRIGYNKSEIEIMKQLGFHTYAHKTQAERSNINYILDTTMAVKKIIHLTKRQFISYRSNMLMTGLIESLLGKEIKTKKKYSEPDIYNNIMLYTIDVGSPIEPTINRRVIFPFLYHYIKNKQKIPQIDQIILAVINTKKATKKPIFIKIYDSRFEKFYFSRSISILKAIKLDTVEKEEYLKNLSLSMIQKERALSTKLVNFNIFKQIYNNKIKDKIETQTNNQIRDQIDKKIATAITTYLEEHPDKSNLITSVLTEIPKNVSDTIIKSAVVAAITTYHVTGDEEKTEQILNSGLDLSRKVTFDKKINANNIISQFVSITDTYLDRIIERYSYKNDSTNSLIKNIELDKVVDGKIPETVFYKKQQDFLLHLTDDISKLFKTFEDKTFPLTIESINIEETTDPSEIKKTYFQDMVFTLKDENGQKVTTKISIPLLSEDGTFMINGIEKVLVNQLILKPVYFPKPHICKITSFFSTMTIENRFARFIWYLRIYLAGLVLPMFTYLAYSYNDKGGPDFVLKKMALPYKLITDPKEIRKERKIKNPWTIDFYNGQILFFDRNKMDKSPLLKSMYQSMRLINYKRLKITGEQFMDPNFQGNIVILATGHKNAPYRINSINSGFLDPITKELLENDGYPTNLFDLIWWAIKKVQTDYVDRRADLHIQRVRSSEVFAHAIYKQLLMAYSAYQHKKHAGIYPATFEVKPMQVFKQIANSELVRIKENVNPAEELSIMSRTTYVGLGGLGDKAGASDAMRAVDESMFHTLSASDTPEGGATIGILQHMTVGALIRNSRGEFEIQKPNSSAGAGILSTSEVLTPFSNHNEGARMIMATNQSRQALPLKHSEQPLVQTGYETILASFLSKSYIKRTPVNGIIYEMDDNSIVIKSKEKETMDQKISIDVRPSMLRSGQAVHSISYFKPKVKTGQKVKRNQLVAEGSSIKDGTISQGRNLLTAYMPYRGYNFEDGIVISSKLAKQQKTTSKHIEKIEVFLQSGSKVLFAPGSDDSRKDISSSLGELLKVTENSGGIVYDAGETIMAFIPKNIGEYIDLDTDDIGQGNAILVKAPHIGRLVDVEIYSNDPIEHHPKLAKCHYISKEIRKTHGEFNIADGQFKNRGEKYEGIIIIFTFEYEQNGLNLGDKYCNRHGNKGVVSLVEDNMPITPWGEPVDIIFSPLGVISRMNLGQILELYTGLIGWEMRRRILKSPTKKTFITLLTEVYQNILDKSDQKIISKTMINAVKKMSAPLFKQYLQTDLMNKRGLPLIFTPFKSPKMTDVKRAMNKLGLKDSYNLMLPSYGPNVSTKNPVQLGFLYIYKLEHMGTHKLSARSTARYSTKTMQPLAGKKNVGGQRLGEFDSWSLFSYNATSLIKEFFGPLSDDVKSKNQLVEEIIRTGSGALPTEIQATPSRDILEAYFRLMMLDLEI